MAKSRLEIEILADHKGKAELSALERQLRGLDAAAGTAQRGFGGLQTVVGTGLVTAGLAGVTALGALGTAVGATGFRFNDMEQQALNAFTTMLGSAEEAKSFLQDLTQFAATTPFEFPGLVDSAQKMLAMGWAAEDILPDLTAIGDAVAALGGSPEKLERVTMALGQIQAKGKASAEEMLQLTEAGIPAWDMLAEAIGTSVPEAMKLVSDGAIDAETTIDAVITGMESRFGGMMEMQSQTWSGLLSTVTDTFGQMSGTIMKPFFNLATEGLKGVVALTSSPTFVAGVDAFAQGLTNVITAIQDGITAAQEYDSIFAGLMETLGNFLPEATIQQIWSMVEAVTAVTQPIVDAVAGFVEWQDVLVALGLVVASIVVPALVGMVTAAAPVVLVAAGLIAAVAALRTAWESDFLGIRTFVEENLGGVEGIMTSLQTVWGTVTGAIQTAWSSVEEFLGPSFQRIADAFTGLGESFSPLQESFGELGVAAQQMWETIRPALQGLAIFLGVTLTVAVSFFANLFAATLERLPGIVTTVVNQITLLMQTITTVWQNVVTGVTAIMNGDWQGAWDAAQGILTAFDTYWQETLANILSIGQARFTALADAVLSTIRDMKILSESEINLMKYRFQIIWSQIKSAVSDQITAAKDSVITTLDTLSAGAKTALETIQGWWGSMWNTLASAVSPVSSAISAIGGAIDSVKGQLLAFQAWLASFRLPSISFPSIPSWGGGAGNNAAGTSFWRGGLTVVGERGPELVYLPRGSKIESAERSAPLLQGQGDGVTVNVYATVSGTLDEDALAWRIARTIQERQR
ncbi:tape measure protein [bacterium]|nr:tape measure protein [bacterium]